jgi:hypothetical protein
MSSVPKTNGANPYGREPPGAHPILPGLSDDLPHVFTIHPHKELRFFYLFTELAGRKISQLIFSH